VEETQLHKKYLKHLETLLREDFFIFLLERWRISSGEHQGEKFSFKDAPCLVEIARDDHPFQVTVKGAQCRMSELMMAFAIWRACHHKGNILYTLPAGEQMQQFVDARTRNAVLTNEELQKAVTGSLNLKKFSLNNNQIYFRGVQKRRQIITVDASILIADEIDAYEEGTLYTLTKRLGAAKNPIRRYFSTPSFHGTGISLFYYGSEAQGERGSDQRVWTIKCECCGKWNENLIWGENTVDVNQSLNKLSNYQPDIQVICRYCKEPLNRLSANAEWVAQITANSNYCHGYHVSKLFFPTSNLNQIAVDIKNPLKEQEVYNSDLGLPYEPKGSRLTDEIINNARGNHLILIQNKLSCVIGADKGNKIHAVTGIRDENDKIKIISAAELDSMDEFKLYCDDMSAKTVVIDANPDKNEGVDFQEEREGVWLAFYMQYLETKSDKIAIHHDEQVVHIHRTLMMQIVSDVICEKELLLPIDIKRVRDFHEHLKAPIKAMKQNEKGDWITFYPRTKNPDHYYHAILYMLTALMLKQKPAVIRLIRTFF